MASMNTRHPRISDGLPPTDDRYRNQDSITQMPSGMTIGAVRVAHSLALRAGVTLPRPSDREECALAEMFRRRARHLSLREMLEACAHAEFGPEEWRWPTVGDAVRSGLGTFAFADAFRGVADVVIMEGFESVPNPDGSGWLQPLELSSFSKLTEVIGVDSTSRLKLLPRGGEADSAEGEARRELARLYRFARSMIVDEQDTMDDDVLAIVQRARQLGVDAVQTIRDLVASVLLANPTLNVTGRALFNDTDGNSIGSVLSIDSIGDAVEWMREQAVGKRPAHVQPVSLLVPPSLEKEAKCYARKMELRDVPNLNVEVWPELAGNSTITDPRDEVTTYTGSDTTWYLVGRPGPIGLCRMRGGSLRPRTSAAPVTVDRYGTEYGAVLDSNAVALDYRSAYRSIP